MRFPLPHVYVLLCQESYPLSGQGIDALSESLERTLEELKLQRENCLRIRLSMEEALLRMRDHFGEEQEVCLKAGRRFGRPFVQIELEGEVYNPLSKEEAEVEDWSGSLLTAVGLIPQYSHTNGKNTLRLNLPKEGINPVLKLFIALAVGIVAGLFVNGVLSASTRANIVAVALDPLFGAWTHILTLAAGPIIFLMCVTTILNTAQITEQGGSTLRVLGRYLLMNSVFCLSGLAAGKILFIPVQRDMSLDSNTANSLLEKILSVFPSDMVSPLIQTNTPQILLMALVMGNIIFVAGSRADSVARLLRQLNVMGLYLADLLSRLVPFVVFLFVSFEVIEGEVGLLKNMWVVILLGLVVAFLLGIVAFLYVARSQGVSWKLLREKTWEPFLTTLRRGSLGASFGQVEHSCIYLLGMERHFTAVSLPHGLVLNMPVSILGTLLFVTYAALYHGAHITPLWLITAMVLTVLLIVATPPVPGANLLAYAALFSNLGIPSHALIDAMVFDILFGIFATAANQRLLQLDLILQADKLGLLNKERLRK